MTSLPAFLFHFNRKSQSVDHIDCKLWSLSNLEILNYLRWLSQAYLLLLRDYAESQLSACVASSSQVVYLASLSALHRCSTRLGQAQGNFKDSTAGGLWLCFAVLCSTATLLYCTVFIKCHSVFPRTIFSPIPSCMTLLSFPPLSLLCLPHVSSFLYLPSSFFSLFPFVLWSRRRGELLPQRSHAHRPTAA